MIGSMLDTVLAGYDSSARYWTTLRDEDWPNDLAPWIESSDDYDAIGPFWLRLIPAEVDPPRYLVTKSFQAALHSGRMQEFAVAFEGRLSPLVEDAKTARRENRELSWAIVRRGPFVEEFDEFFSALGGEFREDDWRSWALVAENSPGSDDVRERCYRKALALNDRPELHCDLAHVLSDLGLHAEAGAEWMAGRKCRPGLRLLPIGDELLSQNEIEDALRVYELAVELAPNPKIQLEMGCLLLARSGAKDLSWAYPFTYWAISAGDETFSMMSELDGEFLKAPPSAASNDLPALAVKALARAQDLFLGYSVEDWSGSYVGPLEARMWEEQALKALGIAFAVLKDSQGAQSVYDELQSWGFAGPLDEEPPESFISALPGRPPPSAMAQYWEALERRLGHHWRFLCTEAKGIS